MTLYYLLTDDVRRWLQISKHQKHSDILLSHSLLFKKRFQLQAKTQTIAFAGENIPTCAGSIHHSL